jgi:type VI secretion system protein ImpM
MTAFEAGGGAAQFGPAASRVGFFGKLPGRGDFVRRDLPNAFVDTWDAWVQQGMEASRATLGDAWLDSWLCAPIWRFAIPQGICGPDAWAGVMMPSVDRAGRYFPLTLAAPAPAGVPSAAMLSGEWITALEAAALSALGEDTDFDRFGETVLAIPAFPPIRAEAWVGGWRARARHGDAAATMVAVAIAAAAQGAHCVFATNGGGRVAPAAWVLPHLPPQRAFIALIDDMDGASAPAAPGTFAPGMAVPLAIGGAMAAPAVPTTDTALGHAASLFGSDFATDAPPTLQGEPPGGAFDRLFDETATAGDQTPGGAFDMAADATPGSGDVVSMPLPDVGPHGEPASVLPGAGIFADTAASQEPDATAPAEESVTRRAPPPGGEAPADPWQAPVKDGAALPNDLFGDTSDDVPARPSGLFDHKDPPR